MNISLPIILFQSTIQTLCIQITLRMFLYADIELIFSPLNKSSSAKFLVCFNIQDA